MSAARLIGEGNRSVRTTTVFGTWVRGSQSELSIATGSFMLAGGVFATANATLLRASAAPRPDLVIIALLCFIAGITIFIAGRRFTGFAAGALMIGVLCVVVPSVWFTPTPLRAINLGLLFLPFFIYLVWFLPMWFARVLGYTWIGLYAGLVLLRFGGEITTVLLTLAITGAVLGELIGHFKAKLERASITDPLCDVWNKRGFERLLGKLIPTAQRAGQPLSMLYLDLDGFKAVNDEHGHAAGDLVLQRFAAELQQHTRPQDVFARFGGDEFALLLVGSDAEGATRTGARLQRKVPDPRWSFGVSEWRAGESPGDFISRADLLMLTGKRGRKAEPVSGAG